MTQLKTGIKLQAANWRVAVDIHLKHLGDSDKQIKKKKKEEEKAQHKHSLE